MKKYNRVIALVLLLGICFPIINPISNIVYASEDGQIIEEEEVKETEGKEENINLENLLNEINKLKENEENLTAKEFSEELLKIKEKKENLKLLEELKSEIEELENILKVKKEKEAEESEKPKEPEDENELEKVEEFKKEIKKMLEEIEELIKEINESEISENYNTNKKSRSFKLTEDEEKLNDFKNQLDNNLSLDELKNLKEKVTLFKTEVAYKLNDLDTKNSDKIVYIVTDKDEASTKEKYKNEFGEVIVTDYIIKIFEEVKYDKTKYLTKEEAEGKDLIVILEKDINFRDELLIYGTNPDMVSGWELKVQDNLNSFKLIGKDGQREIPFGFLTQSVKTEIDNIKMENHIISGGYGHDVDLTIKNSYIDNIIGNHYSKIAHPSKKESKININIEKSTIDEMVGVHSNTNEVADYTYEFDFNIKDSQISKFLGCMTLIPKGDYLDIVENKVNVNHVNITTENTDFQHFIGVFGAQGAAGMGAEVGDVNINLDNIKVGKIDGMESSNPYNEGYMTAIMDSTNTMADYSFGNINFSMDGYSIEKALIPFKFKSMNPREANVNINKIDLKLTDGGDKKMGKADHYIIGYLVTAKEKTKYPEYEDLIHPINFNVAEGINVELEKVLASSVYLFNSYSERNQTPKNMSINSDINIKIDDQGPGKGVYYIGLGANTGFNGDIVYNYGGNKYSNGNYFDMKSRKDPGNRFGEYLEENQSGGRTLIYNPKNIVKGINAFTGKPDTLGVITGFKEIYLSTPLIIFGSNNLKQYAEGMKETKLYPLTPYKVENNSIVEDEWKLGDELIIVSPMAGEVPKDTFIQGWTENPPYNLDYFPAIREEIPSTWFLSINVTLHGNGGKFKNGEYDFYEIHVSDEGKKLEDYLQESDTDNYFELDGNGNIVLDNEGKPIDLKPVHPKEGFEFDGWTISKDGSIEEDENKRIDFDEDTVFTKNLNIYAKWKDNNVYELEGKNTKYTVGEEVSEEKLREDIIELATKNDIDTKSEVEIEFLDKDINLNNLTENAGTYKVKLKLGSKEVTVDVVVVGKFKVTFDANGGSEVESQEIVKGETATKPTDPTKENHEFVGWYKDEGLNTVFNFDTEITEDITLYAKWEENEKPVEEKFQVIFDVNGGSEVESQEIVKGETATKPTDPTKENHKFVGWYKDEALTEEFNFESPVEENITLYAKWEKVDTPVEPEKPDSGGSGGGSNRPHKRPSKPEKEEIIRPQIQSSLLHKEYINGYPDNTVRPEGNLTREEASAILDRVTEDKSMTKRLFNYPDVENNRWSYNNIENLSNKGGIKGYPDGEFKPVNKITRAEAATILVRLENAKSNNKKIPEEIKNHWAKEELITAIEKGWIKGYEDGSIKADNFITRAEFVTLVNRMQNRKVKNENILENIKHFNDLEKNAWYYEDIVEAANTHNYEKERLEDGSEKWTSIIK